MKAISNKGRDYAGRNWNGYHGGQTFSHRSLLELFPLGIDCAIVLTLSFAFVTSLASSQHLRDNACKFNDMLSHCLSYRALLDWENCEFDSLVLA